MPYSDTTHVFTRLQSLSLLRTKTETCVRLRYVTDAFKVATTPRTNVETKPEAYETSVPRVFTAGDMHRGQSLVVWAIREGREAAKAVDESLMGYSYL